MLQLFLEVTEKQVKNLQAKCEFFILSIQSGEEDEVISDKDSVFGENQALLEVEGGSSSGRKKKRRFKNEAESQAPFLLKLALGVYFFINSALFAKLTLFSLISYQIKRFPKCKA